MHPMLDLSQWEDATPDPRLIIADGRSVTVGIRQGCLVVKDGPRAERERIIPAAKAARRIKHVMILGSHGYVSLEAYRWMADNDVTWTMVDQLGRVIRDTAMPRELGTSGGYIDPMLERRQAFCYAGGPLEETGVQIIRRFITSKLAGQAWNAEHLLDDKDAAKFIFRRIDDVAVAADVKAIGGFEGQAAAMYWKAWAGVTPVWRKPTPIKPHWVTYPGRKSLNYDDESNRNATDPVNALLNWGYKIAETEAVLACRNVALSPTMGISHLDLKSHRRRNAFALDLMECMRPAVDEIVLDAIGETMDKRLFAESPQGVVTIEAPLTHAVAARVHTVAYKLVPDVKYALDTLHG